MPRAQTGTPRNIRIPDDVWEAAKAKAKGEGTDVSSVTRELIDKWVDGAVQTAESTGKPLSMSVKHRDQLSDLFKEAWELAIDGESGMHSAHHAFIEALYAIKVTP